MKVTFLGTSSGVPTSKRNHTAILLGYENENILFDCGEGTQRQFRVAGLSPCKLTRVLLSHWHGDHILGLPGLLQTLAFNEYGKTLCVYGPRGTGKIISLLMRLFKFVSKIDVKVKEVSRGEFLRTDDFCLKVEKLDHANSHGYRFEELSKRKINTAFVKKLGMKPGPLLGQLQRGKNVKFKGKIVRARDATFLQKGRSVAVILDTAYCQSAVKLAKGVDLLVCESTYTGAEVDKAKKYKHLTAKQAAQIAKQAKAKKLMLTHFSQRYKNLDVFVKEAKKVFLHVQAAKDFSSVSL